MLSVLLLLCVLSIVVGHGTEFDEQGDAHLNHKFRILHDVSQNEGLIAVNASESHRRLASDYWDLLKNHVTVARLDQVIEASRGYSNAKPFPHMSAMDIFPKEVLDAANLEIPDNPPPAKKSGCVKGGKCYNSKLEKAKNAFHTENQFGPATRALFTFMQSPVFTRFLEKLSGIPELIPDGSYRGAGIHQTLSGGFLNVHADFNLDKVRSLHRRVNVFIYLNPDWKEDYGGHLELWSRDLKRCEARISPDLGKLVVFSSTDFSYHGHQSPLTCPEDRSRRSLAMYYYTKTRPSSECINNNCLDVYHTTLFQKTVCPDCNNKCFTGTI